MSFSGSLTAATPSFLSPELAYDPCSPVVDLDPELISIHFHAQSFRVSSSGTYTMTNLFNTFRDQDSILLLYSPTFDPSNPVAHLLAINDDLSGTDLRAQLSCPLTAGSPYVLVTSTYWEGGTGDFTDQISGPGTVTLGAGPPTSTPTATPILTATATATLTATTTPTDAATPTPTSVPSATASSTAIPTPIPTETATFVPAETPTGTVAPSATPTITPTPTQASIGEAVLTGTVVLQGRQAGTSAYQVPLQVTLSQPTGSQVQASQVRAAVAVTTDVNGAFTVPDIPPGIYDIEVKQAQAISRIARGVTLQPGENPSVPFGTLYAGDMNDDNAVSLFDYNLLRAHFGTCEGNPNYDARADVYADGCISLQDYNILRLNFGKQGPLPTV